MATTNSWLSRQSRFPQKSSNDRLLKLVTNQHWFYVLKLALRFSLMCKCHNTRDNPLSQARVPQPFLGIWAPAPNFEERFGCHGYYGVLSMALCGSGVALYSNHMWAGEHHPEPVIYVNGIDVDSKDAETQPEPLLILLDMCCHYHFMMDFFVLHLALLYPSTMF